MDLIKQKNLKRVILSNWETLDLLESSVLDKGNEWIKEMALQGQRLLEIKEGLKHGEWKPWIEANFPRRYDQIVRCMRIASHWNTVPELSAATSLRQALALCESKSPEESASSASSSTKHWPPHIEATLKLSKFVGYVERFPIETWPAETTDKAREELLPLVKQLWPEGLPPQVTTEKKP
jgi:hypothetical protein